MTEAYNIDCMEYMKTLPDKYFDLAIVDPPYGDGLTGDNPDRFGSPNSIFEKYKNKELGCHYGMNGRGRGQKYTTVDRTGGGYAAKYGKKIIEWDVAPGEEYFNELRRVSKNQVIWGGELF